MKRMDWMGMGPQMEQRERMDWMGMGPQMKQRARMCVCGELLGGLNVWEGWFNLWIWVNTNWMHR